MDGTASHFSLPVTGMTCAGCAGRVERSVAELPGISNVSVSLALERLEADGSKLTDIVGTVRQAGYDVRSSAVKLDISGMTCAGCAGRIERALATAPGVLAATVNLALNSAEVRFIPEMTNPLALIAVVEQAGYTASQPGDYRADAERDEQKARSRDRIQLIAAIALTAPLVVQMFAMWLGLPPYLPSWAEWALATPVQFWVGARFYRAAWSALKARAGNMDQLVVLGTSAAYFYSIYLMLMGHGGHLYFEASATVVTLILVGKVLENRAKRSAAAALRSLMAMRPQSATLLRAGEEVEVAVSEILIGDIVVLKPGEKLAVDGEITRGESEFDESLVTGESMPVHRKKGEYAIAGSINGSGAVRIRATRIGDDTTIARIARMVEQAQTGKAPVQKLVDRISAVFVPAVMAIAFVTFVGWLLTGAGVEPAFSAAVSVLVIACPCALGLATPTALVAGTGIGAQNGILIRDIEALERARMIDTVVFDKTGTLTAGKPEVTDLVAVDGNEESLLALAASVQSGSEHPLGKAVLLKAREAKLPVQPVDGFKATVGQGVSASLNGKEIRVGRQEFVSDQGSENLEAKAETLRKGGKTVSWLGRGGAVIGLIAFADTLRAESRSAVVALQDRGVSSILMTGDNPETAGAIAFQAGISDVRSSLMPADKEKQIDELQASGRHVAMVGDGVNDAPALARADLGVAMGSGTDVALETAGVVLMRPDPRLVSSALDLAKATGRKIWQNLFWAFGYNVVCIPVAALGYLSPTIAGAAMAFSSVSVVSNSLLLKRWRPSKL